MRVTAFIAALVLGVAAGIAAVAVHRSPVGLLLGVGTALVTIRALRLWLPGAATAFAGGWLVPLVFAVAGRPEGDVAVASDTYGWLLIVAGFVVLVTGILSGRPPAVQYGSNRREPPT